MTYTYSTMATVIRKMASIANKIVKNDASPDTLYRTGAEAAGRLAAGWTVVRDERPEDSSLPLIPTSAVGVSDLPSVDKDAIPSTIVYGPKRAEDISSFFMNPNADTVYDLTAVGGMDVQVMHFPGLPSRQDALLVSAALKKLCAQVVGADDPASLTAFLMGMLQLGLTYSTVRAVQPKDDYYVTLATPNKQRLNYEQLRTAVYSILDPKGYENPLRQYLRLFSATTYQGLVSGRLIPNEKVMMQHGVLKKWTPFAFDFMWPNYSFVNDAQILAWQLAQSTAFSRKTNVKGVEIRNTSELQT